ncbi:MAG: cryptochrome/photolyase family protein, partial [Emticicia sp.]
DKAKKIGLKSCPFNSLYWHFYERNRTKLEKNPRIGMAYVTLNKMPDQQRNEVLQQAEFYLSKIEEL